MNIKLDSILLFALVSFFIMNFRLSPGDTPYWFFGLIFLGLLVNILVDILPIKLKKYLLIKDLLLWILIITIVGSAFISNIIVRHQTAPVYMVHDIILQQESAINFLTHGKNPYAMTYFNTPMEQWHYSDKEVNPALYHFVMEPFYLLFALPFYILSNRALGYFDGRIPLLFLLFTFFVLIALLVNNPDKRRQFLVLAAFHPSLLPYTLEGRSDIFMFTFLFLGLFLLYKKKLTFSGIALGLAFSVKQSAWPILPFYFAYLFFTIKNIKKLFFVLLPFFITIFIIIMPFFLWNQKAFIDSTINYLSGTVQHSYPISGYGLGKILEQFRVIRDARGFYPFQVWQAVFCLPLLIALIIYLKKHLNIQILIVIYGIFLFVYWYLSRYFNNSHLAYLSLVFITAYFWPRGEEKKNNL